MASPKVPEVPEVPAVQAKIPSQAGQARHRAMQINCIRTRHLYLVPVAV